MRSLFGRIKTKVGLMYVIIFLTLVVLGLSYGAFIYFTDGFKVSDLMISNLMYSIEIIEDGSTSEIENNKVIIPGNTKGYFYITISSVNPIDSKYTLGYKSNNNVDIKYTDKTNNLPNGLIKGYDEKTYNKKVKVVIDNTSNTESTEILFNVFGGYTYNSYETISLKDGYLSVTGPYIELISGSKTLVSVVEKDTSCNTNINNCYYEDSISNYLQYPEDSDITKNLWRIIGTYNINGEIITKMISISNYSTTLETLNSDLTTFNNTLIDREEYLESTNKFNCNSEGCTSTDFNDIGLLSKYEYELIGSNSYLSNYLNYYVINNGNIELLDNSNNNINLRPVVYVKNETKVKGSGTISNPYRFTTGEDINLLAYTLDGEATDKTYEWLKQNKAINKITCENGTIATWDAAEGVIKLKDAVVPDYCTIDFKDGYTVSLTAINGTVTSANSVSVGENGSVTFNVTPSDGYKLDGSTVTCTGTAAGTITSTGVKISNVSESQTCTITLKSIFPTLAEAILRDNTTISERTDFSVTNVANTTGIIYKTNKTEDGSYVYYYSGNTTNNWVKFGENHIYQGQKSSTNTSTKEYDTMEECTSASSYNYNCTEIKSDLYWRIIRTNEDGSVRLLYSGTSHDTTSGYIGTPAFNTTWSNPMYVGYMYGTSGSLANNRTNTNDSTIKTYIDTWYENNLLNYDKYISKTAIYCDDRSVGNGTYNAGSTSFYYGGHTRLYSNKAPTYKCGANASNGLFESTQSIEDKFSASTESGGNGKLKYPIALMTADEISFAGGVYERRLSSPYAWYYTNSASDSITGTKFWWLLSSCYWDGSYSRVFYVSGSNDPGRLDNNYVNYGRAVRPVVSLASCAQITGTGTSTDPYKVVDSSCS